MFLWHKHPRAKPALFSEASFCVSRNTAAVVLVHLLLSHQWRGPLKSVLIPWISRHLPLQGLSLKAPANWRLKRPASVTRKRFLFSLQIQWEFEICRQLFWTNHHFYKESSVLAQGQGQEEHGNTAQHRAGFFCLLWPHRSFCQSEHHCSKPTICKDAGQWALDFIDPIRKNIFIIISR